MENRSHAKKLLYDVELTDLNTLKVRAWAKRLVVLDNIHHISTDLQALDIWFDEDNPQQLLKLGEGSNTFFAHEHYSGTILLVQWKGIQQIERRDADVVWRVASGESWHQLVMTSLSANLKGLENLALIPGTVGAAPVQNIGAYGVELADCLEGVGVLDLRDHTYRVLSKEECQLGYRHSLFKTGLGTHYLILFVDIRLSYRFNPKISYEPLQHEIEKQKLDSNQLTALTVAQMVMQIRQKKLPDPKKIPNLGSFFKNPIVSADQHHQLKKRWPTLVAFPFSSTRVATETKYYKLAAGWLLEHCGFKGARSGAVGMHVLQSLVLINCADREAGEYLTGEVAFAWVNHIQSEVAKQFGVKLEIEPRVV